MLRVDRLDRLLDSPLPNVRTRPRGRRDLDVLGSGPRDPAVPAEGQRRTFDAPAEQSPAEVAVEASQGVEVDLVVVEPEQLDQRVTPPGPQSEE